MRILQLLLLFPLTLMSAGIIPAPQSITERQTQFKIGASTRIVLGSDSKAEQFIAEQLNEEIFRLKGIRLKVTAEDAVRKLTSNFIYIGRPATEFGKRFLKERNGTLTAAMRTEGYFLDADANGIVIIAEAEKGLYYGVMSLLQLLEQEKRSLIVRGVSIHDHPAQRIRGITDDISRGQISTLSNFKEIIRFCARYKLNVYSLYMEDIFVFRNHPEIGKDRGALTAAECKELDAFARQHYVEIIPIFETLGHWENILIHPEYSKYGEFPGAHTVNVSDPKVLAMLDEMIGEIAACFSSPYFNIAADESWDVGLGANKERVKRSDLATVHAEHYKNIFEIVKKHGKKPMMYGDIILDQPAILQKIPKEVVMVDWHYGAAFDYPSPEIFRNAGFPYVVSPAVWNFTGPFPNYINTFLNIAYLNKDGAANGALGILCSSWNDFGGEALRELNYYGYAWNAECAWNPSAADQTAFDGKFFRDYFGAEDPSDMKTIYSLLSTPANQFHWYELWRHPLLPNRDDMIWEKRLPLIQRMQSIRSTIPFVLRLIDDAKKDVTRNAAHLQVLSFIARLNLCFADKIEAQETIKLLLKDTVRSAEVKGKEIAQRAEAVRTGLTAVRAEFERVWLTTNKPQGLSLLLNRYDRQLSYWNEIAQKGRAGADSYEPTLQSQWLYHPSAQPGVKDSAQVPKAYFRKVFSAGTGIRSAKLQLLGDTWVKLTVNGKPVGSVEARRSLSLIVENQRAKIFDITPFLTDTLNVIGVEAQNFQPNGSAGVNVYAEIVSADGSMRTLQSDGSWLVKDTAAAGWNTAALNANGWLQAVPKRYPVPVVAPDLVSGRTSWFER